MCTRLIVTSLLEVGVSGVVAPISLSGARSTAEPVSLNTVGHGDVVEHGSGDVTLMITSDSRKPPPAPPLPVPPAVAVSWSMTRNTGELPSRTTSPHEMPADMIAASPINRMRVRMSLALDDL